MADKKVTFAKGNKPLPTDIIPGRLIVAEDTGDTYIDTEINKRIQLKDNTKLSTQNIESIDLSDNMISGINKVPSSYAVGTYVRNKLDNKCDNEDGKVLRTLEVRGNDKESDANSISDTSAGVLVAGRNLKVNGTNSIITGVGNDIGDDSKKVPYNIVTGQGNKVLMSYNVVHGAGIYTDARGGAVIGGNIGISNSLYSISEIYSRDTKVKIGKNSITLIDCSADNFTPANEENFRVELTREKMTEWVAGNVLNDILEYNNMAYCDGGYNVTLGANQQVNGSQNITIGEYQKQYSCDDLSIGAFNKTAAVADYSYVHGRNNHLASGAMYAMAHGHHNYAARQVLEHGDWLKAKQKQNYPGVIIGRANNDPSYPTFLMIGNGEFNDWNVKSDIPDYANKSIEVGGDVFIGENNHAPVLTVVDGAPPTDIPDDSYDKIYKEPFTLIQGHYQLRVGWGKTGSTSAPGYSQWKKLSSWQTVGWIVDKLPTAGNENVIYYKALTDPSWYQVYIYEASKWRFIDEVYFKTNQITLQCWKEPIRRNIMEVRASDDVLWTEQFPECGDETNIPSPTKPGQLVNKKYVDGLVSGSGDNFKLVVKHTIAADKSEQACYFSNEWIEDENGQATAGEAFNFKEILVQMNIPIIDASASDNYTCNMFTLLNTNQISNANNRVAIMSMSWKKNTASNIAVHSEIRGGRVFTDSGYSAGNTSNRNVKDGGYCNVGALVADNITSVMLQSLGVNWPTGTAINIYAR